MLTDQAVVDGIEALRTYLGADAACFLREAAGAAGEAAAFELQLPSDYLGVERVLRIGFPSGFPDEALTFSISPDPWLVWPHCMRKWLCLFTDGRRPSSASPAAGVVSAMRQAQKLIQFSMAGSDDDERAQEFEREIRSYWTEQGASTSHRLTILGLPSNAGSLFVVSDTTTTNRYFVASNAAAIADFERRQQMRSSKVRAPAKAAFFLPLHSVPPPRLAEEGRLLEWLVPHAHADDTRTLEAWVRETSTFPARWILVRLPGADVALWAFHLRPKVVKHDANRPYGRRAGRRIPQGQVADLRREAPSVVENAVVDVIDHAVIHSRNLQAANALAGKRIVMVGLGSLGGEVASLLARAGVGHLGLVDPEALADANVGRHVLGGGAVGYSKVHALKRELCRAMPTVEVAPFPVRVQQMPELLERELDQADIVVVTSANWASEAFLWRCKAKGTHWALVQSWSEPHSRVGHVLSAPGGAFDGSYLFDDGRFRHAFSQWIDDGVIALPACGQSFIPGGPIMLSRIASLTAQVVVDVLTGRLPNPAWSYIAGHVDEIEGLKGSYTGPVLPAGCASIQATVDWPVPIHA